MNNYHLTKIKQHFRNSRIIIIGDYNVMLAAHNMLKIKSFKLNRVLNVCECSFNSEVLNILDLHLVNMNEFHPGRVQSQGPFPPDTIFLQALNGKFDVVVAMYHDQGPIPLKLVGFNSGVNVTVGLPFIRTSVDHGTAFEIAWQGTANEGSMVEAIKLSIKLVQ